MDGLTSEVILNVDSVEVYGKLRSRVEVGDESVEGFVVFGAGGGKRG